MSAHFNLNHACSSAMFYILEHSSIKDAGFVAATSASKAAETKTNDILAMISPEGERVGLTKV